MATVYVTIGPVVTRDVFNGALGRSETITSSGTTAQGSLTANRGEIAQIVCATAVYASCNSTAAAATAVYCPANVPTFIGMTEGAKVSVIDVA